VTVFSFNAGQATPPHMEINRRLIDRTQN